MGTVQLNGKSYGIDDQGFLEDFFQWDEPFATFMAPRYSIPSSLTQKHWDLLYFIRNYYLENGSCPLVYKTCRHNNVRVHDLKSLFPSGYLRGACRLAGITYKQAVHSGTGRSMPSPQAAEPAGEVPAYCASNGVQKTYVVDAQGFLVSPDNWDEAFSVHKAVELKMPEPMTGEHWRVIHYLREQYARKREVPVVYDTCNAFNMEIEDLENLFPDGYHRGAVKIAGLPAM